MFFYHSPYTSSSGIYVENPLFRKLYYLFRSHLDFAYAASRCCFSLFLLRLLSQADIRNPLRATCLIQLNLKILSPVSSS